MLPINANSDIDILCSIKKIVNKLFSRHKIQAFDKIRATHISLSHCAKLSDVEFIFFVYRNLLGREPSFTEYACDIDGLHKKTKSRIDILRTMRSNSRDEQKIILNDDTTEREMEILISGHNSGKCYLSVEDFHAPTAEEFVACAYRKILQRDPDPSGMFTYCNALRSGGTCEEVLKSLLQSNEAISLKKPIIVDVTPSPIVLKHVLHELEWLTQHFINIGYKIYSSQTKGGSL